MIPMRTELIGLPSKKGIAYAVQHLALTMRVYVQQQDYDYYHLDKWLKVIEHLPHWVRAHDIVGWEKACNDAAEKARRVQYSQTVEYTQRFGGYVAACETAGLIFQLGAVNLGDQGIDLSHSLALYRDIEGRMVSFEYGRAHPITYWTLESWE